MTTLELVYQKIEDAKNKGLKPLVVFDLDDTLIDCRYRKRFVLREFCLSRSKSAAVERGV